MQDERQAVTFTETAREEVIESPRPYKISVLRRMRTQELWLADDKRSRLAGLPAWTPEGGSTSDALAAQSPPPARIGKYEIEAETGDASRSVRVFHAADRDTGRPVTLKVLTGQSDPALSERFRREIACAANVRHEGLVAIYELSEHAGLPFSAMQYLGDDDLRKAIQSRRPLTLLQKMLIMWQVAEGARAAGRGGLAYIGIRPSAIALSTDGRATLKDFGDVRLTGEPNEESASYLSPEERTGRFLPDALCDIFAFGTIYYELLTGTHPFPVDNGNSDLLNHELPPLRGLAPECPRGLDQLVCRALAKNRELRYQSWDELQSDAEPVLREGKRARAAVLLADIPRLAEAQELDKAQSAVQECLALDSGNEKVLQIAAQIRGLLQRRGMQARVEVLSREADEEAAAGRLDRAVEILEAAVRLDASNPELAKRKERLRSALEQRHRSTQLVAEARLLLDRRELAEAQNKALEALETEPQNREAIQLRQVIAEAIKRRDAEISIGHGLTQAKTLLWARSFDEALSVLAGLNSQHPGSPLIEQWLAHAEAQKKKAERRERLAAQLGEARSLLAEQRFAEAVARLEALRTEYPEENQVRNLLAETLQSKERAWAITQAKAQCDRLLLAEQFDQASAVVDAALGSYPAEPSLVALKRRVEQHHRDFESAAALQPVLDEAEWLLQQDRPDLAAHLLRERSADFSDQPGLASRLKSIEQMLPDWRKKRFVQDALTRAGALEQRSQWPVALTVVEEALEACPTSLELLEAGERLKNLIESQERAKRLARRLEIIGQKISAQAWPQALSLIEASLTEFPGEPKLQSLAEDVRRGARHSRCESIIAEVRQCLSDEDPQQAEEILRKGRAALGEEPALEALRVELENDKKYREEWRAAQVLFGRRQFDEAERILVQLAEQNRPDAQSLLETVREARASHEEGDFYGRGREKALKLIEQRHFQQAADLLNNLLALFPGDAILERALRTAQAGRDQCAPGDAVTEAKEIGDVPEPESPAESAEPAPLGGLAQKKTSIGARVRSVLLAVSTLLLLISGAAVVWTFTRSELVSAAHEGQEPAAPLQAPVSPSPEPEGTQASSTSLSSELTLVPEPGAVRVQAFIMPPDPSAEAGPREAHAGAFRPPEFIAGPSPVVRSVAGQPRSSEIHLEASVDARGTVKKVTMLSGSAPLVSAATSAVLKWRFAPASLNDQALERRVRIRIIFTAGEG